MAVVLKTTVLVRVPGVQIPPSPPRTESEWQFAAGECIRAKRECRRRVPQKGLPLRHELKASGDSPQANAYERSENAEGESLKRGSLSE